MWIPTVTDGLVGDTAGDEESSKIRGCVHDDQSVSERSERQTGV